MSWRTVAAPIIRRVIAENPDPAALRKALVDAYPFGERKYHPYKIWCDEIQRQLGKKPPLGSFGAKSKAKAQEIDRVTPWLFDDTEVIR